MVDMKYLIEKLQEYKFEKNLTGDQLADLLGCSRNYISQIFQGRLPGPKLTYKIKKLLSEDENKPQNGRGKYNTIQ